MFWIQQVFLLLRGNMFLILHCFLFQPEVLPIKEWNEFVLSMRVEEFFLVFSFTQIFFCFSFASFHSFASLPLFLVDGCGCSFLFTLTHSAKSERKFIHLVQRMFFPLRVVKYFSPVSMFSNDFRSINENAFEWSVNFFTRYVFWAYVQCTIKDPMKDSWNYVNRLLRRLQ